MGRQAPPTRCLPASCPAAWPSWRTWEGGSAGECSSSSWFRSGASGAQEVQRVGVGEGSLPGRAGEVEGVHWTWVGQEEVAEGEALWRTAAGPPWHRQANCRSWLGAPDGASPRSLSSLVGPGLRLGARALPDAAWLSRGPKILSPDAPLLGQDQPPSPPTEADGNSERLTKHPSH